MSEVADIPSFPPLNACLLIDSRMSSRKELKAYIDSTNLFENVVEPDSLTSGISIISKREIDTCVLGPSLKGDKVDGFFADLKASNYSGDCAFLLVTAEGGSEILDVHSKITFPCTRKTFNDGIIEALKKANRAGLVVSKRLDPLTGEPFSLKDIFEKLLASSNTESIASEAKLETLSSKGAGKSEIPSRISDLADALKSLELDSLGFETDGRPTMLTQERIRTLTDGLFTDDSRDPDILDFKCAF